jgi:hypothetical protein
MVRQVFFVIANPLEMKSIPLQFAVSTVASLGVPTCICSLTAVAPLNPIYGCKEVDTHLVSDYFSGRKGKVGHLLG